MIPKMSLIGCGIQLITHGVWSASSVSCCLKESPILQAFCCFGILGPQASRLVEYPTVWVCLVASPDYMQLKQTLVEKETG